MYYSESEIESSPDTYFKPLDPISLGRLLDLFIFFSIPYSFHP